RGMNEAREQEAAEGPPQRATRGLLQHALPWLITIACFAYLYFRIGGRAPAGQSVPAYLASIFAGVDWPAWLALMIPYSLLYLLIDTAVLWRVVGWFNTRVSYRELLPIRASAYIISILNEQVGKGAIGWYLNRRHGVPGWQVASSMLFIMLCEPLYLLLWAVAGVQLTWERVPELFHAIPAIALAAVALVAGIWAFFRLPAFASASLRERQIFHAFRRAAPWQYLTILLMRSPALLAAVFVYSRSAALFGVEIPLADMLGFLPVIFFGTFIPGPFRAAAVTMWTVLFPEHTGQMAVFGLVMHNFFVLFNAAIGAIFLPKANRELARA
ncbi:MAG TPA: hypothetical protein VFT98_19720, partial [Myxococcota bacterium]|nr:hypothetical protein [Myxococcota bacterium]